MNFNRIKNLLQPADTKIVLLVMDGLGGLPKGLGYGTELETAKTPNLDDLAKHSLCGLHQPVGTAITPGSGPAHLALFGYDPPKSEVGRGVLSALGIAFDLKAGDVAARGNFCTDFDFFYVHVKKIDSAAEDGDFDRKVALIEEVDRHLPRLLELKPDVLTVTGDHSTPSVLKSHSWHPVPVLFHSLYCRPDHVDQFGERACMTGGLGPRFPANDLMPLALVNAGRLRKFGA